MTVTVPESQPRERAKARTLLIDVDVHPLFLPRDILPRLPERWRTRYANEHSGRGPRVVRDYPRWRNGGFRIDAAVPGGAPGSDLGVLRAQLLEEYDTDIAILIPLTFALEGPAEYKAALCRAINDWLAQEWLDRDPRLRGSVNVPFDSPDLAVGGDRAVRRRPALRPGDGARRHPERVGRPEVLADLRRDRGGRLRRDVPRGRRPGQPVPGQRRALVLPRAARLAAHAGRAAGDEPDLRGRLRRLPGPGRSRWSRRA